ncbi:N-acetylmuramoyl-L-alanine amidase [Alteribacillus sp. YIM 98480]|uniref:N-acetylmuramoyl-L-alanine amidase n=1 Tax=Alteribacillus sp. YIM 98480 TaxID=2606599 RepID=UPI00131BF218|nr:N-acetylmuramoyl-L-alanine amidase [Alteribacillus sp. YIM 98480]
MRKKISYSILAAAVSVSFLTTANIDHAEAFNDVGADYWAKEEISYLAEESIVDGRESGDFGPEEEVARAQAAKMMSNALSSGTIRTPASPTFSDVNTEFWAFKHIEQAAELEVFTGKKDGRFDPNGNIERAQVAAIIGRAFFGEEAENNDSEVQFEDISAEFWAKGYIATLAENGIIEDENNFRPNENATRAEVSAYLARAMEKNLGEEEEHVEEPPSKEELQEDNILFEGEVNAEDTLNARSGPGMDYKTVTEFEDGTKIDIYENNDEWLKTEHNGEWLYVYHSYIEKADDVKSEEPEETDEQEETDQSEESTDQSSSSHDNQIIAEAKAMVSDLNVRLEADEESDKIGKLDEGDIIDVYEHVDEDWALVDYNGEQGYVHRYYLQEKVPGESALTDKTIVIDAGHGDHDNGASANGLVEKEVVLDVALEVEERLEKADVNVVMTRSDDTFLELSERVEIAEETDADSFVSIHANAASPAAEGAETFYNNDSKAAESKALAESIQDELVSQTEMSDRRVAEAGFYVIKNTTMPSTLIELGFLTNTQDTERMKQPNYEEKAADAVYDGIVNYYDW